MFGKKCLWSARIPIVANAFPLFQDLRQGAGEVADVFVSAGVSPWDVIFSSAGEAAPSEQVFGEMVSGSYFKALGVNAVLGRVLSEQDASVGNSPVAVISHRFWTRRFGGSPDVLGRSFTVSETAVTIIGVAAPESFGVRPGAAADN
jgi:MacB-like periplasmic core domain